MATYVMSDIHGQYKAYIRMLKQIGFNNFNSKDKLIIAGDAIDRGPGGIAILNHVLDNQDKITMLMGNHELMMLDALNRGINSDAEYLWYSNGGLATHEVYTTQSVERQHKLKIFLESLQYTLEVQANNRKYVIAHGRPLQAKIDGRKAVKGPMDHSWIQGMSPNEQIVWGIMHPSYSIPNKTIVFGHRCTKKYHSTSPWSIFHADSCIGIDCGCAYRHRDSRLGCIRLNDGQEFYAIL